MLANTASGLRKSWTAALILSLLPGAAWAQNGGTFRGSDSGAWANSAASVRSTQPRMTTETKRSREVAASESAPSSTKLKWRPVRGAVATQNNHSDIQLTAGESDVSSTRTNDRYSTQRVVAQSSRGPAARTAQNQSRSVLGAQDPFEASGKTAPKLGAPQEVVEETVEEVEDAFPTTKQPGTTKKADPFGDDSSTTQPDPTFQTEEPAVEPESDDTAPRRSPFGETEEPTEPMPPRQMPTRPMPESVKKAPKSPSDHDAEEGAQTDKVDCEAGRKIVQASGLDAISLNLYQKGKSGEDYPEECPLWDEAYMMRCWAETTYTWKASALCHKPLYFEDVQLERYGHEWGPIAQPVVSAAHFFGTLPILPYKMGLETPDECVYALGYYRPNSCAPYMIEPIGFTWRAALFEAGAVVGAAAVLP